MFLNIGSFSIDLKSDLFLIILITLVFVCLWCIISDDDVPLKRKKSKSKPKTITKEPSRVSNVETPSFNSILSSEPNYSTFTTEQVNSKTEE